MTHIPLLSLKAALKQSILNPVVKLEAELLVAERRLRQISTDPLCLEEVDEIPEAENTNRPPPSSELLAAQILSILAGAEVAVEESSVVFKDGHTTGATHKKKRTALELLHEIEGLVAQSWLNPQLEKARVADSQLQKYCHLGGAGNALNGGKTLALSPLLGGAGGEGRTTEVSVTTREAQSAKFLWSLLKKPSIGSSSNSPTSKKGTASPSTPLFAAVDDLVRSFLISDLEATNPSLAQSVMEELPPPSAVNTAVPAAAKSIADEEDDNTYFRSDSSRSLLRSDALRAQVETLSLLSELHADKLIHSSKPTTGQEGGKDSAVTLTPSIRPQTEGTSMAAATRFPKTLAFCRKARAFIRYDPTLAPHTRPTNSAAAVYYAAVDALYRDALSVDFAVQLREILHAARKVAAVGSSEENHSQSREGGRGEVFQPSPSISPVSSSPSKLIMRSPTAKRKESWMIAALKPIAHMLVQYHTVLTCHLEKTVEGQISALRRLSSSATPPPASASGETDHVTTEKFVDKSAFEFALSPFHTTAIFEALREMSREEEGLASSATTALSLEQPLIKYQNLVGATAFLGPMVVDEDYFQLRLVGRSSGEADSASSSSSGYSFLWDDAAFASILEKFLSRVRLCTKLILECQEGLSSVTTGSRPGHHKDIPEVEHSVVGSPDLLPTLSALGRCAAKTIDQLASVNALPMNPSRGGADGEGEESDESFVPITLETEEDKVLSAKLQALLSVDQAVGRSLQDHRLLKSPTTKASCEGQGGGKQFSIPPSLRRGRFYCPVTGAFMPSVLKDHTRVDGSGSGTGGTPPVWEKNHPRFLTSCGHVLGSKAFQSLAQMSRQRASGAHPTVGCPYCSKHCSPADAIYLRY